MECPICHSKRILSKRHDIDWGGGDTYIVNLEEDYTEDDLWQYNDIIGVSFNVYVCLECDFIWEKYGNVEELINKIRG